VYPQAKPVNKAILAVLGRHLLRPKPIQGEAILIQQH